MGGRGSYTGRNGPFGTGAFNDGIFFEKEYKTIDTIDDVKVIDSDKYHDKMPEFSRTPNSIYATVGKDGNISHIQIYGQDRTGMFAIDFDTHEGINPHYHTIKYDNGGPMKREFEGPVPDFLQKYVQLAYDYNKKRK